MLHLVFLVPVIGQMAVASTIELSGRVLNFNGTPKEGVTVTLARKGTTTVTDQNGVWSLQTDASNITSRFVRSQIKPTQFQIYGRHLRISIADHDIFGHNYQSSISSRSILNRLLDSRIDLTDTLLFLWGNKVFLRDTVSQSRHDIIRIFDTTWNSLIVYGWFTDERDGKIYRSAKIGNHLWMAQNLNYQADTSWCYNDDTSYCDKYGRLYNWASALNISQSYNNLIWKQGDIHKQGICPYGWHIPNNDESDSLLSDAEGTSIAGLKLKASFGWNYDGAGRDSFGFRALPTGYRDTYGKSVGLGDYGQFWSATEYGERSSTNWQFSISYYVSHVVNPKIGSFSVRCVKD